MKERENAHIALTKLLMRNIRDICGEWNVIRQSECDCGTASKASACMNDTYEMRERQRKGWNVERQKNKRIYSIVERQRRI